MKRFLTIFLSLTLIFALVSCGKTEEPDAPVAVDTETVTAAPESIYYGKWYGSVHGLSVCLDLQEEGKYSISFPSDPGKSESGTWKLESGRIWLDGDETDPLIPADDYLQWSAMGTVLSREEKVIYTPAAVRTDASQEEMNGYWVSLYVETDGAVLFADDLQNFTDVYIEGERAAMGGPLFGDVAVDVKYANGTLTFEESGVTVKMSLQEDGLLRMDLKGGSEEMTIWLYPSNPVEE